MFKLQDLFPTSTQSIQAKGAAVANGTGPVRMKKGPNLLQSILGVFIGVILLFAAPVVMWKAQSQHRAKDFQSAHSVNAQSSETGYITISGIPEYKNTPSGEDCIDGECIYQKESQQELVTKEELVCGNNVKNNSSQRILYQDGSECDEDGNCVPCYQVEKDTWEEQHAVYSLYDVVIGNYTVAITQSGVYLDTETMTIETGFSSAGNETRSVYTYFQKPTTLLVSGHSDGSTIRAGEKTFVISAFDAETTLSKLKSMDRSNQYILWIITYAMIFFGLSMILGPLAWAGRLMRHVPVIGPMLSKGSKSVIGLLALVGAIPIWMIIYLFVVILKLWWVALIAIALIGAWFAWKAMNGKKTSSTT